MLLMQLYVKIGDILTDLQNWSVPCVVDAKQWYMQGEDTHIINTVKLVFDVILSSFVENDKFWWNMKCYS
jgi:hypothetical protein